MPNEGSFISWADQSCSAFCLFDQFQQYVLLYIEQVLKTMVLENMAWVPCCLESI